MNDSVVNIEIMEIEVNFKSAGNLFFIIGLDK